MAPKIEFEEKNNQTDYRPEVVEVLATFSNAVKVAMTRDYANYEELAAGYLRCSALCFSETAISTSHPVRRSLDSVFVTTSSEAKANFEPLSGASESLTLQLRSQLTGQ
jgi:hypothetical protein